MSLATAIQTCLRKYAVFTGRASRPEFWWFVLFGLASLIVCGGLDSWLFGVPASADDDRIGPVTFLMNLFLFLPMLAVGWRRLHDVGKPGWYVLIPTIISIVAVLGLFSGVAGFTLLERSVADSEMLRAPAALLGATGMMMVGFAQLVMMCLLLWWWTRPSEAHANAFGPPPPR